MAAANRSVVATVIGQAINELGRRLAVEQLPRARRVEVVAEEGQLFGAHAAVPSSAFAWAAPPFWIRVFGSSLGMDPHDPNVSDGLYRYGSPLLPDPSRQMAPASCAVLSLCFMVAGATSAASASSSVEDPGASATSWATESVSLSRSTSSRSPRGT